MPRPSLRSGRATHLESQLLFRWQGAIHFDQHRLAKIEFTSLANPAMLTAKQTSSKER